MNTAQPAADVAAYSIADFARRYGIGRTLAYAEISAGRLHTFHVGRRALIAREDADDWLQRHRRDQSHKAI